MDEDNNLPEIERPEALVERLARLRRAAVTLEPGFHVMHEGVSLGRYDSAEDAEAFANAHPRHNGLEVSVEEVKG